MAFIYEGIRNDLFVIAFCAEKGFVTPCMQNMKLQVHGILFSISNEYSRVKEIAFSILSFFLPVSKQVGMSQSIC